MKISNDALENLPDRELAPFEHDDEWASFREWFANHLCLCFGVPATQFVHEGKRHGVARLVRDLNAIQTFKAIEEYQQQGSK